MCCRGGAFGGIHMRMGRVTGDPCPLLVFPLLLLSYDDTVHARPVRETRRCWCRFLEKTRSKVSDIFHKVDKDGSGALPPRDGTSYP